MPHKFNVYKSSAGSGKTFTLTKEYLKIALRDPKRKFSSILAITFTVKATNEMKSRILEACEAFSSYSLTDLKGRNKGLFQALIDDEDLNLTESQIRENAKTLYRNILHNYSDFGVSTIDSFSQRLIRSFAFELNLPVNYEVEMDQDKVVELLTDQLIDKIGRDEEVSKLLMNVFMSKLTDKDSIRIRADIENIAKEMLNEKSMDALNQFRNARLTVKDFRELLEKTKKVCFAEKETLKNLGKKALQTIEDQGLELSNFSGGSTRGVANYFRAIAEGQVKDPSDTFHKVIAGEKDWYTKTADSIVKQRIDEISSSLINTATDILALFPKVIVKEIILNELGKIALITELHSLYKGHSKKEGMVLISEFNQLIAREVNGQPAPFIFEKVGEKYNHVLIDEFQDTSIMQWQNMLPMLEESLSDETFHENLVVGDSKQAIYRWRGGETRQLSQLPNLIGADSDSVLQDRQQSLIQNFKEHPLNTNYRSREYVIQFNNLFFKSLKAHPECVLRDVFEAHEQEVYKANSGGWVTISTFEELKRGAPIEEKIEKKEERLQEMIRLIKSALGRGYKEEDIVVLNRGNKENQEVAEALAAENISFSSQESLRLRRSPIVRLFPALIALMRTPSDHVLQAQVANALSDLQLLPNQSRHQLHTSIAATRGQSFREFSEWIQNLNPSLDLNKLDTAELLSIWESLVNLLPAVKQNNIFISFFRDELWNFIAKNGNNIDAFLDWWEEKQSKLFIKSSDQAQGVQIMTIHKSKGLEFDIVLIPFADWAFSKSGSSEYKWLPIPIKELDPMESVLLPIKKDFATTQYKSIYEENVNAKFLDNLNLLYVATTRAVSEIHIFSGKKIQTNKTKKDQNIGKVNQLINYFLLEQGSTDQYEYGEPTKPLQKETESMHEPFHIRTPKESNGEDGIALKNKASVIWNDDIRDKIDFGETVHQLLAETETENDLITSIERAKSRGWINETEISTVQNLLERVVENKDLQPYFQGGDNLFSEQPIVMPNGEQFIPDRMIIDPEQKSVRLLDFKTGKQKASHEQQVNHYAQLLEEMGYQVKERLLVYIDPFELKRLLN